MPGYTITKIEGNTVFMEKKDGHGGISNTGLSVDAFIEKFKKEPKIGMIV